MVTRSRAFVQTQFIWPFLEIWSGNPLNEERALLTLPKPLIIQELHSQFSKTVPWGCPSVFNDSTVFNDSLYYVA